MKSTLLEFLLEENKNNNNQEKPFQRRYYFVLKPGRTDMRRHSQQSNILILIQIISFLFLPKSIHCTLTTILHFEYYTLSSNYLNKSEDIRTNGIVSTSGSQSIVNNAQAFVLVDQFGRYDACLPTINPKNYSQGIAIIQRGGNCTFSVKVTRAKQYGAAGRLFLLLLILHLTSIIICCLTSCPYLRSTRFRFI